MHAEGDIDLPILYVCPSVQYRHCVKTNGHIATFFDIQVGHHSSFLSPNAVTKFQGNRSAEALNTRGWENVGKYCRLSRKRYKV